MKSIKSLAAIIIGLTVSHLQGQNMRIWTSTSGTQIEAEVISQDNQSILLKTKAGTVIKISKNQLSDKDKEFTAKTTHDFIAPNINTLDNQINKFNKEAAEFWPTGPLMDNPSPTQNIPWVTADFKLMESLEIDLDQAKTPGLKYNMALKALYLVDRDSNTRFKNDTVEIESINLNNGGFLSTKLPEIPKTGRTQISFDSNSGVEFSIKIEEIFDSGTEKNPKHITEKNVKINSKKIKSGTQKSTLTWWGKQNKKYRFTIRQDKEGKTVISNLRLTCDKTGEDPTYSHSIQKINNVVTLQEPQKVWKLGRDLNTWRLYQIDDDSVKLTLSNPYAHFNGVGTGITFRVPINEFEPSDQAWINAARKFPVNIITNTEGKKITCRVLEKTKEGINIIKDDGTTSFVAWDKIHPNTIDTLNDKPRIFEPIARFLLKEEIWPATEFNEIEQLTGGTLTSEWLGDLKSSKIRNGTLILNEKGYQLRTEIPEIKGYGTVIRLNRIAVIDDRSLKNSDYKNDSNPSITTATKTERVLATNDRVLKATAYPNDWFNPGVEQKVQIIRLGTVDKEILWIQSNTQETKGIRTIKNLKLFSIQLKN